MIRQNQKRINIVFVLLDVIIIIICMCISYIILGYFNTETYMLLNTLNDSFILYLCAVVSSHLFFYYRFHFYESHRVNRFLNELHKISKACIFSFIFLQILSFILFNRQIIYEFVILCCLFNYISLLTYKYIVRKTLQFFRSKGYNLKYLIIVGKNSCTEGFIKKIEAKSGFGYKIVGIFGDKTIENIPFLGEIEQLDEYLKGALIDEVIITIKDNAEMLSQIIDICNHYGTKFTVILDIFSVFNDKFYVYEFDNILSVSAYNIPLENTMNYTLKRVFDIVFSIFILIICSPIMIVICLLVKATSEGAVIYKQARMGINRKEFIMYKFRSMRTESDPIYKMTEKNDERCTPIGAFLRKYSIDELPQIFNVLKGDMSWVGPRPERPYYVNQFQKEIPLYMVKHYIKPGITGWAQVNGLRGNTSIEQRIKYDIYYIENWTFGFDIKIIFLTLYKGIFNENAY